MTLGAVLFLDVIEHVEDDAALIRQVSEKAGLTDAQTLFLFTVPAFQFLFSSHDVFLGHYRRYTLAMLEETFSKTSLAALDRGYFFFTLLLPRLLNAVLERIVPPKAKAEGVASWRGGRFLTALIRAALLADYRFCRFLAKTGLRLPGLSCYAAGRPEIASKDFLKK